MNHVAIDLGSRESQVCVRSADGTIVAERKHKTSELKALLSTWEHSRVIVETASEAFRIADAAQAAGHEVRVVPSILSKQLGIGERGVKTDLRDARKLSEVSCRIDLPSVHIPSAETRELRATLRSRSTLIGVRTQLINRARAWMRTHIGPLRVGWPPTVSTRIRESAAQHGLELPLHVEQVLVALDGLAVQIRLIDADVRARAKASSVCQRLMTVPGVGPITAISFVAAIETPSRFKHAHRVQSYLGLTPGEDSSAQRQHRTSITKAGPEPHRKARRLVGVSQAAIA